MIDNARKPGEGILASVLGVATLLFGASGVFGSLQDSLNTIWEVQPKAGRGIWGVVKDRFLSLSMVLGVGFLLLISLVITTALEAVGAYFGGLLPSWAPVLQALNLAVSFGVITLLFAMIFKYLPDAKVDWGDVWLGSAATALLFIVGKYAIGLYLGKSSIGSSYGAAGSFVVLLVWIYYSAQILFFGAEFTKVYAGHRGTRIAPAANAEPVTEEARAHQGIPQRAGPRPQPKGDPGRPAPKPRREEPMRPRHRMPEPARGPDRLGRSRVPPSPEGPTKDEGRRSNLALRGAAVAAGVLALLYVRSRLERGDEEP
jgi:membrane protein